MKPRRFFILLMMALCWIVLPASASTLGDIRVNARFLTDRMAYELRLTNRQYDDIFEINYDFFYNVDPYVDRMSYGDPYALDMYYRYLDERNDDIRWVLSRGHYMRFMKLDYFFLPIYAVNRVCHIRIYNIYPNRTHFYYGRPSHYFSYRGSHCRHNLGGVSFYQTHYRKHYHHSIYKGHYQSVRTRTRGRDFPTINHSSRPARGEFGRYPSIRDNGHRTENGISRLPSRPTDRHSGTSVTRPTHSERHRVVTDRSHSEVRRNPSEIRRNPSDVRRPSESVKRQTENLYARPLRYEGRQYESSSTRVSHSSNSGVSHRSQNSTLNHRSHSPEVRTHSQRTTVRQHSSSSRSRSQSGSSSRSERSERRGARER